MNSLVDDYLFYVSSAISNYSKVLLRDDENITLDKLTDIIYDYLNEVFLLKRTIGKIDFDHIINIKLQDYENSLLNIIMEYGLIDRVKLKDKSIKKSYVFVVDTINYFINIERNIYKNADFLYDRIFQSIMRGTSFIDKAFLKEKLIENESEILKLYKDNCDCLKKMNISIDNFGFRTQKISNNMYYLESSYNNEKIYDYNEKEVLYVLKDYQRKIYLNSLENLSLIILKELFENKKNKYFIFVPDYALSKTFIKKVLKIFNVYAIRDSICLLFDIDYYLKIMDYDDIFDGYDIGVHIGYDYGIDDFSLAKYMIIEYDETLDDVIAKNVKNTEIFANGKIGTNNKNKLKDMNIKYFTNIRVGK